MPFSWLKSKMRQYGLLEPVILGCIVIAMFLLLGFMEIADDMMEGDTHGIDKSILMLLRDANDPSNAIGPHWLADMMRDISALGGIAVLSLLTLFAVLYLVMLKKYGRAAYLALITISGTLLSNILKSGFDRPRPDFIPNNIEVFTASFPSGHSMMSAVVYLSLGALLAQVQRDRRVKIYLMFVAIVITLMIGFSRLYLGVHWPSDVLAGWMIGALWALVFWTAERWYLQRQHMA